MCKDVCVYGELSRGWSMLALEAAGSVKGAGSILVAWHVMPLPAFNSRAIQ